MIPASFDYSSPKTLSEAISLLKQYGSDAKILAGGQSLIPLMKLRMAAPKHLIDLNGITDLFTTALAADEILTEIRVPIPPARSGGAYLKVERKVGDFAAAAVAAQVTLDGNTCKRVGIGLTNVGVTPIRAVRAENALLGK